MTLPDFIRHPNKSTVIAAFVLGAVFVGAIQFARMWNDPNFIFLVDRGGAHWIFHQYPDSTNAIEAGELTTAYYTRFSLARPPEEAVLEVQALRAFSVGIDGRIIRDFQPSDRETWKAVTRIDLAPYLSPGNHQLDIIVKNHSGPTAAWARSPELGIYSDESWSAYIGSGLAGTVALCRDPQRLPSAFNIDPAWIHFVRVLPLLIPVFVLGLAAYTYLPAKWTNFKITARTARAVVAASAVALLLLGLNNMFRLPHERGFDAEAHYDYMAWIADGQGLPLAPDGWQMFQSPLYYVVAAPFYAAFDNESSTFKYYPVRLLSIVFGAMHPLIAYIFATLAWPGRPKLHIFATLFAAFLPVNIYMAQYVGNEPMMSVVGAVALLLGAYILQSDRPPSMKISFLCGLALGLALLTKASAVLLLPTCFLAFTSRFWGREGAMQDYLRKLAVVAITCFVVAGWYYIRNWIRLGEPFVGGWESRDGLEWWQLPGFRTWNEYLRFGRAVTFPVYAAVFGLWDALYSTFWLDGMVGSINLAIVEPMWNMSLLNASAWVALLPMTALLIGAIAPLPQMLRKPNAAWSYMDRLHLFALSTLVVYIGATLFMHMSLPIWSGGKASYLTAATPLLAFLATRGYLWLSDRGPSVNAAVVAGFVCWFVVAYFTYMSPLPIITDF